MRASGNDNSWISSDTIYGYEIGQTNPANYLVYSNSNAIVGLTPLVINSSNAIIKLAQGSGSQLPINNSNAIIKITAEMQTIDHGPEDIIINTPTYTMDHDIYLSEDHTLQFMNSCEIDGNGHTIYFPSNSAVVSETENLIQIADNSSLFFSNITLENYNDSLINFGSNSQLIFGNLVTIKLDGIQALSTPWIFNSNGYTENNISFIQGGSLSLGSNGIQLSGMVLFFEDTIINDLGGHNLLINHDSEFMFNNTSIYLANDFTFTSGSLYFTGEVSIQGPYTFNYKSGGSSLIDNPFSASSTLYLTGGITFNYDPLTTDDRDLIEMTGPQTALYLNGCTLASTTTGMRLTYGSLIVDGENFISNNAKSLSQATCFGSETLGPKSLINGIRSLNLDENLSRSVHVQGKERFLESLSVQILPEDRLILCMEFLITRLKRLWYKKSLLYK